MTQQTRPPTKTEIRAELKTLILTPHLDKLFPTARHQVLGKISALEWVLGERSDLKKYRRVL